MQGIINIKLFESDDNDYIVLPREGVDSPLPLIDVSFIGEYTYKSLDEHIARVLEEPKICNMPIYTDLVADIIYEEIGYTFKRIIQFEAELNENIYEWEPHATRKDTTCQQ